MMKYHKLSFLALLCAFPVAFAQTWEVGGGVGGSFFTSQSVTSGTVSGQASLTNGVAASIWVGNNSRNLFGGELRYDYENSGLKLSSGGTNANFAGDTHAIHYDLLWHFTSKESRIRPYVAAGAGVKFYRGTGYETAYQPLENLALLTKTTDTKPLLFAGGGVKFAVSSLVQLRVEVHDSLTPFPTNVITPAAGAKLRGWLQDLSVTAGISMTF